MSNRTDWKELALEILTDYYDNTDECQAYCKLKERVEKELHSAFVAGQENPLNSTPCGGYPIHLSIDGRVVLNIRNDEHLAIVKRILEVRDEAKAKLEGLEPGECTR